MFEDGWAFDVLRGFGQYGYEFDTQIRVRPRAPGYDDEEEDDFLEDEYFEDDDE